jgi:general secretion pathway protein E
MNILKEYRIIPLEETPETLKILCPKNVDMSLIEEIRFLTGKEIIPQLIAPDEFSQILQKRLSEEEIQIEEKSDELYTSQDILFADESAPAVSFVNAIIIKAVTLNASDIHFEPYENKVQVRLRLDGVLHNYNIIPVSLYESIVSRVKVLSNLDVAEKRMPQDGKIRIKVASTEIDIRVSVVPTTYGERVVLRLLPKSGKVLSLEELGLIDDDLLKVKRLSKKPYGIILSTGPTGSGKTTTLYSILMKIRSPNRNIITIEDPPEYQIEGVSQIQVNPKVGLTFAQGLRAILRQDPDVIMIGEIRDSETAQIAVQSALTGHLVLTTLHTNDAPSAIARLADLAVEPFLLSSSLEGIIAQRLVRRICPYCKVSYEPTQEELSELGIEGKYNFYRGIGCDKCMNTGYRGRIGIFEVLEIDESLKKTIIKTQDANVLREEAKQKGFTAMFEDALKKVIQGITTAEEILMAIKAGENV